MAFVEGLSSKMAFPSITWEKSHVAGGKRAGLTNLCAFGPQRFYLNLLPPFITSFFTSIQPLFSLQSRTTVWKPRFRPLDIRIHSGPVVGPFRTLDGLIRANRFADPRESVDSHESPEGSRTEPPSFANRFSRH